MSVNGYLKIAAAILAALSFASGHAGETALPFGFGYPLPREVAAGTGATALPQDFSVSAPRQLDPALADFQELLSARGMKLRRTESRAAFLRLELAAEGTPEHPQGYNLEVGSGRVAILARTPEGLFNGLQTLRMMMLEAKKAELPTCRIADWPLVEKRGVAFSIHGVQKRRFAVLKKMLRTLAALKYNRAIIEFGDNFPFAKTRPGASREALTTAEIAELKKFAADRFIEIVPMLRIWSYSPIVNDRGDDRLLEDPRMGKDSPYCPLKPALAALLKNAISEQCALLGARKFVFLFDRRGLRQGFRHCDECRKLASDALIAGHLKMLENACAAAGADAEFIFDHFDRLQDLSQLTAGLGPRSRAVLVGAPRPGTSGAASPAGKHPVAATATAAAAAGTREFSLLAFDSSDNGRIVPARDASPWFFGEVADAASYLWSKAGAPVPADPVAMFFRVFESTPTAPDVTATPVPLEGVLNAELSRCEEFPLYRDRDELEKVRRTLAESPDKFRLVTSSGGRYYGVLLAATGNDKIRPVHVTVDLGKFRASAVALLIVCTPPLQQAEYLPQVRGGKLYKYGEAASVTFNYANGRKVVRPLRYMVDITDWNRRFGGYGMHLVYSGAEARGRVANWWSCRLKNPHPELPLATLTFATTRRGGIAPALLAISLLGAEGGSFKSAPAKPLSRLDFGSNGLFEMPKIVTMNFEDSKLAPASLSVKNAEFAKNEQPEVSFPADAKSPSNGRSLMIRIPAAKAEGGDISVILTIPGSPRGAVRSLGFSCRIDHPEHLCKAFQELTDTYSHGTYLQRFYPDRNWRAIWTAFGNPDPYSRVKLRDPHRSNARRIIFCFKELPEPVTIWIDDIAHSRWDRHTMPYLRAE